MNAHRTVLLAIGSIACSISACLLHLKASDVEDAARLQGVKTLVEALERDSVGVNGLLAPASLPVSKADAAIPGMSAYLQRYQVAVRSGFADAEPTIKLPTNRDSDPNEALLEGLLAASSKYSSDREGWLLDMRKRVRLLLDANACRVMEFGTAVDLSAPLHEEIVRLVKLLESTPDGLERAGMAHDLLQSLDAAESLAVSSRPMPVMNGEGRGTMPSKGTPVSFCEAPRARPSTQTLQAEKASSPRSASFTIQASNKGPDLYARLVYRTGSGRSPVWTGYLRSGGKLMVELSAGDYDLRYASGDNWYGEAYLFGPGTRFRMADDVIDLRLGYNTTIDLIPQVAGNLREKELTANEF
jgi:hypothetical protein